MAFNGKGWSTYWQQIHIIDLRVDKIPTLHCWFPTTNPNPTPENPLHHSHIVPKFHPKKPLYSSSKILFMVHYAKHFNISSWLISSTTISSLTPDHKMSGIHSASMHAGGVQRTVGKLSMRATTLFQTLSWLKVWTQNYSPTKLWEFQPWQFRDSPFGVPGQKTIWM
jgi:hypothetical protein